MKSHKKILFILAFIFAVISIYFIVQTFAKYISSVSGDTGIAIARWNISVNNQSIKDGSDFSTTLTPVFPGNSNIAANVIAPTATGYFDLVFDFSQADVSFKYDISTSVSPDSSVKDLIVTGYSVDSGAVIPITNGDDISDQINYSDNITARTVRVYIMWDDSSSAVMNNIDDAGATKVSNGQALMDVKISFTQTV